uniref:Uncharacterized protein n=1 Tax=Anguilla anguilla TaxID=7936 RepID=A0A0E9SEJ5_ANGAN
MCLIALLGIKCCCIGLLVHRNWLTGLIPLTGYESKPNNIP